MAASGVPRLYRSVIDDVINNVREAFLDEGVDEQILIELKQTWEKKLNDSKAIEQKEHELVQQVSLQSAASQQAQARANAQQQAASHALEQQHSQQLAAAQNRQIAHQLSLPTSSLQQALMQYAAAANSESGDNQKTVTLSVPQKISITLPAQVSQQGLPNVMSAPAAAAHLALPPEVTASLLQQAALSQGQFQAVQVNPQGAHNQGGGIIQLDGANDTSDDDDDEEDFPDENEDRDENDDEQNENEEDFIGEEEQDPLNSEDDVSDDDPSELFETDNVVVCQYDKITRSRNRWKFHLKDGIMNLQGRDYVFQRAVGDAEW